MVYCIPREALIHSSVLILQERGHSLTINLSSMRIWCYSCETEVYPEKNIPSFM